MVLAETDSTMDPARADGSPGLIVVADRQTAGRGRLGRAWADTRGLGLAVTFTLDAERFDPPALSISAGLASLDACLACCSADLGLRWPNDVVERAASGRKLAGVLIERVGQTALVGIGINVHQSGADFPETLRGRAASLAMLNGASGRLRVLERLIESLAMALDQTPDARAMRWGSFDVLVGTHRVFEFSGRRYAGVVESIRPTSDIRLRTADGLVTLPALATSMVHDA